MKINILALNEHDRDINGTVFSNFRFLATVPDDAKIRTPARETKNFPRYFPFREATEDLFDSLASRLRYTRLLIRYRVDSTLMKQRHGWRALKGGGKDRRDEKTRSEERWKGRGLRS